MMPIPLIKSDYTFDYFIKNNADYWLDSSNDNFLINLVNNESLVFKNYLTGIVTEEQEPIYVNRTVNSVSRRTFQYKILQSDSFETLTGVEDETPNFKNSNGDEGITVIRVKTSADIGNSPANSSPIINNAIFSDYDFCLTTEASNPGEIKSVVIGPHANQAGNYLYILIGWIDSDGTSVKYRRWYLGNCILRGSDQRVHYYVIRVTPNFTGNYQPTINWTTEADSTICEGILLESGYDLPFNQSPFSTKFIPTILSYNGDNLFTYSYDLECIAFSKVLNDTNVNYITSYLKNKWSF